MVQEKYTRFRSRFWSAAWAAVASGFYSGSALAQSGPVGYWKFDEASGTSVADSSGNSHSGAFVKTPLWAAAGYVNGALTFGGTNAAVSVPDGGNLANLYASGLSIAAWIKPTSAGGGGKGRIVDKTSWMLRMGSATTLEFIADSWTTTFSQRTSAPLITLNTWQHVAVTWDGSTSGAGIHIYVNGALADGASVDGAGTVTSDAAIPLGIGNMLSSLNRGFAGAIDELRLFNRVLSPTEIQSLVGTATPSQPAAGAAGSAIYQYDSFGRLKQVVVTPQ